MFLQAWHIGGTQTFNELSSSITNLNFRIPRTAWAGRTRSSQFEEQRKLKYRKDKWLTQYFFKLNSRVQI